MIENRTQTARQLKINITNVGNHDTGITWFCCADLGLRLFEKQYPLTDGMTYNSYVIEDEKLVVVDTVDKAVSSLWLDSLASYLKGKGGRTPDYIIVQHLEPDHSYAIERFMSIYSDCNLVCSSKAASMLRQFASGIDAHRVIAVKEGDELEIGSRKLRFVMAPMVHWPEVMVTYDSSMGVLFSADAFGMFGATLAMNISSRLSDSAGLSGKWESEARRYYINICGKYGAQVQALLKKASTLDIKHLCPLHGPVIEPAQYNPLPLYDNWSKYESEYPDKTLIVAASLHGNTLSAANRLSEIMTDEGMTTEVCDLAEADISEVVSQAFACGAVVFMSATYDASLVPFMRELLSKLKSKNWQKRKVGIVENGSWAPIAAKLISKELEEMKEVEIIQPMVTIYTRLDDESEKGLHELARNLSDAVKSRQ